MAHHASIGHQVRSIRFTQAGRKSGTIFKPRKLLRWNTGRYRSEAQVRILLGALCTSNLDQQW